MDTVQKICLRMLTVLVVSLGFAAAAPAGDLEPPGPPGPTMKTLDEIPPTWSQVLPASERFQLVMNGSAVLDRETGLVWERAPDSTPRLWYDAIEYAYNKNVGGRKGWRLPAVEELLSLMDPSSQSSVKLPSGHPFTQVQSAAYWSSTTDFEFPGRVFYVYASSGNASFFSKLSNGYVWCVRGGHGYDGQ